MSRRTFVASAIAILLLAGALRTVWLTSDPPTTTSVGIPWHDEGPWVHNARNRALFGEWRTDNWNPMFLTPVFTGLEYGAFTLVGVGTWQARTVPVASGLLAIAFLMAGLAAVANRRAALVGGALLAVNYVFVMWNRAALMESTMTSLIVVSWASLALGHRRPAWGIVAGVAAVLAWFTKASAAFYIAAIGIEVLYGIVNAAPPRWSWRPNRSDAGWTLIGLVAAAAIAGVLFVLPHWSEYQFYNWQMSVVRKPSYTWKALQDRATWIPINHDFFMWMWPVLAAACLAMLGIASRWRTAKPAERVLMLWVVVGLAELAVHDSGNERRYVMFMPALIALCAMVVGNRRLAIRSGMVSQPMARWAAAPLLLGLGYLAAGSLVRIAFLTEIHGQQTHPYHRAVTLAAGMTLAATVGLMLSWKRSVERLARWQMPAGIAGIIVGCTLLIDAWHLSDWVRHRSALNYAASVEVGRLLAPGTLVQGKLANGLALENRIRPVFIGRGFGNYDDRLQRDDVRYILTYVSPSVGYESQQGSDMIQELLDHYPNRQVVATFVVNETGPADRAVLIDKAPGSHPRAPD